MPDPDRPVVRSRLVFQIHGYQLTLPERFHRRFERDLATFANVWSVEAETGVMIRVSHQARWSAHVRGDGWATATEYRIVRLDDLIEERHHQPVLKRLAEGLVGLFDFVFDRALPGYVRFNWYYALFTLFPLACLLLAGFVGIFSGLSFARIGGIALGIGGGLAAAGIVLFFAIRKGYLFTLLEDWAFARVLARRIEPAIDERLNEAVRDIRAAIDSGSHDEILLIGHSLGAVLVLHLAERVLDGGPLPAEGPRLGVMTIGSSVLKIGLHSRARIHREAARRITGHPEVTWAEYQSPFDVMNFEGVNPASAMGIDTGTPPTIRRAPFTKMLEPEAVKKLRTDFFRAHNQFFHASTSRSVYDYFMFCCGPFHFRDLVEEPDGAMPFLDEHGALTWSAPGRAGLGSVRGPA